VPHTYTRTAWEKGFEYFKVKELTLYYPKVGNLASASMPWIISEKHGGTLPKDYHAAFMGVAAGGSDCVVSWI